MRVVLLATVDPLVRDVASMAICCDMAAGAEVRHELVDGEDGGQLVRCTVADLGGIVHREDVDLDHGCLSCTVREGLVPTLAWMAEQGRWQQALVTLPVTADPQTVAWQLHDAIADGELAGVGLGSVLAVVDAAGLVDDLLGDDLLGERGLELSPVDARAVGEALSAQIEYADVVASLETPGRIEDALLEHVLPPGIRRVDGLGELDVTGLFEASHRLEQAQARLLPDARSLRGCPDADGVWTIELASPAGFHPDRLLAQIELLGSGPVRSRGCFHLPSRPGVVCVWDGSGGQLSIGEAGWWQGRVPRTRILVTGIDPAVRDRIRRAFDDVLLTEHEQATRARWAGRSDGLEPWLGEIELPQVG